MMVGMENQLQSTETAGPSESHRIAENTVYRVVLKEICDTYRESLSAVASVDKLAFHLGEEWFEVHELIRMAMTCLYLAREIVEREF